MAFPTYRVMKNHPTFLATVTKKGLVTDGVWFRTALPGEEFVLIGIRPDGGMTEAEAIARRRFNRPLWVREGETEEKYLDADSPLLAIRADQLVGSEMVECLLLNHTGIHIVEEDAELPMPEKEGKADE